MNDEAGGPMKCRASSLSSTITTDSHVRVTVQ